MENNQENLVNIMCKGSNCDRAESCYRFKATPNRRKQAYFVNSPIVNNRCIYFWAIEEMESK